jgi:hypothetical protein
MLVLCGDPHLFYQYFVVPAPITVGFQSLSFCFICPWHCLVAYFYTYSAATFLKCYCNSVLLIYAATDLVHLHCYCLRACSSFVKFEQSGLVNTNSMTFVCHFPKQKCVVEKEGLLRSSLLKPSYKGLMSIKLWHQGNHLNWGGETFILNTFCCTSEVFRRQNNGKEKNISVKYWHTGITLLQCAVNFGIETSVFLFW